MNRLFASVVALIVGCSVPDKQATAPDDETTSEGTTSDAGNQSRGDAPAPSIDARSIDAPIDAPKPSVDAGPPPMAECKNGNDGIPCELPRSECLGDDFVLRYTAAQCVAKQCVYSRETVYCPGGCSNGACN